MTASHRKLSAEELADRFVILRRYSPAAVEAVEGHIAALEAELAEARAEIDARMGKGEFCEMCQGTGLPRGSNYADRCYACDGFGRKVPR